MNKESLESQRLTDIIMLAEDEITSLLRGRESRIIEDVKGDVTVSIEDDYPKEFADFLLERGVSAIVVSEGRLIRYSGNPIDYLIFLDPVEGSTNFYSGKLPYGVNIGAFPYREGDILVKEWLMAFVSDRHNASKLPAAKAAGVNVSELN